MRKHDGFCLMAQRRGVGGRPALALCNRPFCDGHSEEERIGADKERIGLGPCEQQESGLDRAAVLARATSICMPMAEAAAVTSCVTFSTFAFSGLTSRPMRTAAGTSSRSSLSCFAARSERKK